MYQIKVNDKLNFEAKREKGALMVNGEPANADIKQLSPLSYHVIHNMASYNVEVISLDAVAKTAEIKVNGNTYAVSAKDQFDLLLDQLGMSNKDTSKISEIKAPMPGLVLKVFVAEGDVVQKGDNLFILEAMKMENIIKAPADVTIKTSKIKAGDKVEKGQVLMLF
ncbi:biotin/lipoyl-containing protein [Mucilaginibacter boryungensis]|uniref:Biotin/lipoyl-binding protein n=1 Tax=Mucilaginibacter boryungensis TaxID=768480 RepID=A0ABR9XDP5_9SPHI|nr:biotin/lipoyl-containing protein [Mucilaginibacter boryungensis]MBE9665188.1 biotin/lipoyl-binding protein [Mucilaginibacter boryungensis]